jgi:hypothetical protein
LYFCLGEFGFDFFVGKSTNEPQVLPALGEEVAEANLASVVAKGTE